MKYIPVPGDIIKCVNTRDWFEHVDLRTLDMISKGYKLKVLRVFQSDFTGNNYNVTVMPLYEQHKDLRINLTYRVGTREFSYYHKNTLYAVFLKDETFNRK